jgi:thiosulfate dehydrogenase [quinone] large subunit
LPLRLFLGFTFAFAGLQKLANPAFFEASSPASIQAQLAGAARRSPIHALVSPLVHVAVPLGVLIALAEVAVGVGALLGLWTRVAAAGGMALSLMLFLTVSFHSSPYYTGSDIVFLFAWMPLLLAGSAGAVSADALVAEVVRRRAGQDPALIVPTAFSAVRQVCGSYDQGRCHARRGAPCEPVPCPYLIGRWPENRGGVEIEMSRRTFAAQGAVAAAAAVAAVVGGGLAAGIGRLVGGGSPKSGPLALGVTGGSSTRANPTTTTAPANSVPGSTAPSTTTTPDAVPGSTATATATAPTTTTDPRPPGTAIGSASQVPLGGAGSFNDPSTGDPSLVIQPQAGTFLAFDAVCPHAGCTVQYDNANRLFVCPCHGSQFNANTGAVEQGPAATGLQRIKIAQGPNGELYAV